MLLTLAITTLGAVAVPTATSAAFTPGGIPIVFTSPTGAAVPAPHCELVTGNTYLRTSGGKGVVGFKPKITCTEAVDTMSLTGQMYGYTGSSAAPYGSAPTSTNAGQISLENKQIGYTCNGTASSRWFGRASVTAVWHGIPQGGTVDSPIATLACGL